jgi:DNA end-binding protein Ku
MASEWDPGKYHDDYREAIMDWIEKKAQAESATQPPRGEVERKEETGKVVDMMELLKKSVQLASSRRKKEGIRERAEDAA